MCTAHASHGASAAAPRHDAGQHAERQRREQRRRAGCRRRSRRDRRRADEPRSTSAPRRSAGPDASGRRDRRAPDQRGPRRRARRDRRASGPSALSWCATSRTSRARSRASTRAFTSPFACGRRRARNSAQRWTCAARLAASVAACCAIASRRDGIGQRAVADAVADRGQRVRRGADQRLVERRLRVLAEQLQIASRRGAARCRRRSSLRARRNGRARGTARACSSPRARSASAALPSWPSAHARPMSSPSFMCGLADVSARRPASGAARQN